MWQRLAYLRHGWIWNVRIWDCNLQQSGTKNASRNSKRFCSISCNSAILSVVRQSSLEDGLQSHLSIKCLPSAIRSSTSIRRLQGCWKKRARWHPSMPGDLRWFEFPTRVDGHVGAGCAACLKNRLFAIQSRWPLKSRRVCIGGVLVAAPPTSRFVTAPTRVQACSR